MGSCSQQIAIEGSPSPTRQASGIAWYVIHTRSNCEALVEAALQRKNLEVFLPRLPVPSRRNRRILLNRPLFSGYLFVHADLETDAYYDIIKQRKVVRILGRNGRFEPVPDEVVQSIKAIVASGHLYAPCRYLERGQRVRVVEGPLAGVEGIVVGKNPKRKRIVVAVELFRRAVAVELENEAIEPCR
ncbi:MAG: hypothetical protein K6T55_08385 [Syntrophobacterales bacterium]|nr:hypothetical protein [Syntrophobacterales bacterium]